jgi:NADH:ubiquinone oxidoreductase subunit 6 (subunit J)
VTALDVLFIALAVLAAGSGLLAVTSRQVVHAALWLVVTLGTLAGCYLVLGAEVVALVQLLVYVGAIVVLVLFALMLTRAPIGTGDRGAHPISHGLPQRIGAAVVGLGITGLLAGVLLRALSSPDFSTTIEVQRERGGSERVGEVLFAWWVLPFELLSVLLLAALVGALAVSRGGDDR